MDDNTEGEEAIVGQRTLHGGQSLSPPSVSGDLMATIALLLCKVSVLMAPDPFPFSPLQVASPELL